ncbi:kinase-like domain-containing protein [Suillus variegatus]|nr:kinase-like domain-containing protein [Suillus variegatus]
MWWISSALNMAQLQRDPCIGSKDPNADHDDIPNDAVNGPSRACCQKHELLERKSQTVETLVPPRSQDSAGDVLRARFSSGTASLFSRMPTQLYTTDPHHKPVKRTHKLQVFSKMLQTLQFRVTSFGVSPISSPQSIPQSNLNDQRNQMDSLPDLTGQLNRTSAYATSFGGLSDIWRCTWNRSGSIIVVAVKSIRSQALDEDDAKKKSRRLRRELKVWLRLRHDNIVPLCGTVSGFGQFVALLSGIPWRNLSIINRFQLLSDISAGLQYLGNGSFAQFTSCSVIHGDLTGVENESNVLISSDGRAHLSDFGLSGYSCGVRGHVIFHHPNFLQFLKKKVLITIPTSNSDIYSFGCIFFQVLTGKAPYSEFKRDAQVVVAISLGTKPLRPEFPTIIDSHWSFILNCWSTIEDCRPSSQQADEYIKGQLHFLQHDTSSPD